MNPEAQIVWRALDPAIGQNIEVATLLEAISEQVGVSVESLSSDVIDLLDRFAALELVAIDYHRT